MIHVTNLIQTIFPDAKLPILPSKDLLMQLEQYNVDQEKWDFSDYGKEKNEANFAKFLNQICDNIEKIKTGTKALRKWNSTFCNTLLERSLIVRKPDIVLLDVVNKCPVTWTSV
jgi:hypothetical protein